MVKHEGDDQQCAKGVSYADCELSILRHAVDKAGERKGGIVVNSPDIQRIIRIVEDFIITKKLMCYGGTAINNILPKSDQFYNFEVEIPDYDFFSVNAYNDAIELADIYSRNGFTEVEAKSAQHVGTYKVYVNFIAIADISEIGKDIYALLRKDAIKVAGILYAPANFLRMSMYLELSRPMGDIDRWEKVMKRLRTLNKDFPLKGSNCKEIDFQRDMEDTTGEDNVYKTTRDTLIQRGVVFFGGYALTMYSQFMDSKLKRKLEKFPDFDVLAEDAEQTATIVKERLIDAGVKKVKIMRHEPIGELVPLHFQINVGSETILFIYKPIACHSYNMARVDGRSVKIATIDTMLSFYLAFLYAPRPYFQNYIDRILCMAQFLFDVQAHNRLRQKGILKRFSISCYGHQETLEEIRADKNEQFSLLKSDRNSLQFKRRFMRYIPTVGAKGDQTQPTKGDQTQPTRVATKSVPHEKNVRKRRPRSMRAARRPKPSTRKRGRGGFFL